MRTHLGITLFIMGLFLGNVNAQQTLQLGLKLGIGTAFTAVDYSQATGTMLTGEQSLCIPAGLEVAWAPSPNWRIATGLSYTTQQIRVNHHTMQWIAPVAINHDFLSIPLDVSYRIFTEKKSRKSYWLIGGLSCNLVPQGTSGIIFSSPNTELEPAPGETQSLLSTSVSSIGGSLRMGLSQNWLFGKNDQFILQTSILYSQGLFPIWEGEFLYWDQAAPANWWQQTVQNALEEAMPEPTGRYSSVLSRGSSLALELKFLFNFMRKEKR